MTTPYITVVVTTANKAEAEKIARCLLDEKLIACANIIGPASSLYWWADKVNAAEEFILLMKSRSSSFEKLSERVNALHSYDVPEIIALPIILGSEAYLVWLGSNLALEET